MMNTKKAWLAMCAIALIIISGEVASSDAATCSILQLLPCKAALFSTAKPTTKCCTTIKQQVANKCVCKYLKNPSFKKYAAKAKTIFSACKIKIPKC
ncbi:non-specific lipid-transfer protein 2-like [Andrographis paniculata]|uniref:non-specific lipid-transfer protein 2-like n=1 Tax=Andrographis paniculata TaxID=175694 RepID=UPI0021E9649A|nr:non-specific lipid-transfer protein 2-like [Andrographis paniculata]